MPVQIVQLRYEASVAETRGCVPCATACQHARIVPNARGKIVWYFTEELCADYLTVESYNDHAGTGGPLKLAFGLSGAVRPLDHVFPPLVCVFVPSILNRSRPVPRGPLRSGENCSTASPPDVRTIPALDRIAMNIAQLLHKLRTIANVEIVVPLLPKNAVPHSSQNRA